jgi:ABC-type branched-subunit amino acid transport system substrate-binding protein
MIRATYARILVLLLNIALFPVPGPAQDAQNPAAAATRGKEIYLYGTGYNGVPVEALAGEGNVKVSAAILRCVNCHGTDGRGKPEGGIYPSNIRWTELSKPYAITTEAGRERPPYNERLVIRAVTMGIDSGGNRLNAAMPKYQLTREQADDLVAYLKRLGNTVDPGITDQSIKIGAILPPEKTFGGMHHALQETLAAAFQRVNEAGGLYGRRIVFAMNTAAGSSCADSFQRFIQQEQPFVLVESFIAGSETEIGSCLQRNGIPLIGAISLFPGVEASVNRNIFYLLSGVQGQSEVLVKFAARNQGIRAARFLLIHSEGQGIQSAIEQTEKRAEAVGWERPQILNVDDVSDWALLLRDGKFDAVLWLASDKRLGEFFAGAFASGVFPVVLAPSAFIGSEIYEAPKQFSGRLFLSFPILPTDQTKEGEVEFAELARSAKFSRGSLAERLTALSAAKLLIYALQKAGREVTREKVVENLEKLYQFDTGQTPPLTFTANRRVGIMGAHVVGVDLENKELLIPSSAWIELESP